MKYIEIDTLTSCDSSCSFCNLTAPETLKEDLLEKKEIDDLISQIKDLKAEARILPKKLTHEQNRCPVDLKISQINCKKHKESCFIAKDGMVYPCRGMNLPIGSIRKESLKTIINDSEVLDNLKNHESKIKGPCRKCKHFQNCYGCRARAFAKTKDYLASDPLCPDNQEFLDEIICLPFKVNDLIPQKDPMRVVTTLMEVGERYYIVESDLTDKCPFIKKDGTLEEVVYMEIMAQSAAVMNGFEKYDTGAPDPDGFLIGSQDIDIYAQTSVTDKLTTDISKTLKFGNFGILYASIKHKDKLIAQGEIKIYHKS